ncbi:hypothetical protein BDN71DRAFT_1514213 [Pleurotus eryngii]|uniref:Uncharacterized protein n=1 Tax=Pleurotus eryngii TaxID=5323 RepID=A0A9P6D048_PLEER|nr:hypothetical protein BDN71DRAFT_1514213 [Pleurotus eryngii]
MFFPFSSKKRKAESHHGTDNERMVQIPLDCFYSLSVATRGSAETLGELAETCFKKNDFKDLIYLLSPQSVPPSLAISAVPSKERLSNVCTAVRCIAKRVYTEEQILEIASLKDIVMSDCSLVDISDHVEKWYANIGIETPSAVPKDSYVKAFAGEYISEDHVALRQAMDDTGSFTYSRFLPIVQSSGMGKSKAVLKVSEDRVILQACIRPGDESQGNAVPAQDPQVYRYLTSAPKPHEGEDCKNYFAAFLVALFRSAFKIMHKHRLEDEKRAAEHFLTVFTDNCTRGQFWKDVVAAAEELSRGRVTVSCLEFYTTKEAMNKKYQQGFPLFLCLDKVHSLFGTGDIASKEPTLYFQLRSAAADLYGCDRFRFIALSTFSGLHMLAPPSGVAPSAREAESDLHSPFCLLPLDVHRRKAPLKRNQISLEECNRIDFITTFGRPLWRTFFDVSGPDIPHLMDMVKTKILCRRWPEMEGKSPEAAAILTILSSRLYLTAAATPMGRTVELEAVRAHLRVLYSVDKFREIFFSGSPSEPIISIACAELMHARIDSKPYFHFWNHVIGHIAKHENHSGHIGELIGRAFSIDAMDRVILEKYPSEAADPLRFGKPIKVLDYYRSLLRHDLFEALCKSLPANASCLSRKDGSTTFAKAFENAYLHFSHYARAADSAPLQVDYLWALFARGCAIQTHPGQVLTDRALPMHFGEGPIGPSQTSVILDQDKSGATPGRVEAQDQNSPYLHVSKGPKGCPYIDAIHCYSPEFIAPKFLQPGGFVQASLEAPHYRITVRGLESYKAVEIDTGLKSQLRAMIDMSYNPILACCQERD